MKAEDVLRLDAPKKKIMFVGDSIEDLYIHGRAEQCQDGCQKFVEESRVRCGGGMENAANCLKHSGSDWSPHGPQLERKIRFLQDGRILWRHDIRFSDGETHASEFDVWRKHIVKSVDLFEAVYISDYSKGFITDAFMRQIVAECNKHGIPCVVDPKRDPRNCLGAVLKCNGEFAIKWGVLDHSPGAVITHANYPPTIFDERGVTGDLGYTMLKKDGPAFCVNHVGAGDCFGAWLTLGLAHGLELAEAARLAHAAGRVYVQHPHNRPPWPHEIRKELGPVGGKVLAPGEMPALRQSCTGRVVFTNGVFRLLHAGHCDTLQWAKQQGDILVVGVNDNVSAFRQKPGEFCLPLEQRLRLICSQQVVDFVVPFGDNTPIELIRALKPDCIVKGPDHAEKDVVGSDVCEVKIAPLGPFREHVSDIIRTVRGV